MKDNEIIQSIILGVCGFIFIQAAINDMLMLLALMITPIVVIVIIYHFVMMNCSKAEKQNYTHRVALVDSIVVLLFTWVMPAVSCLAKTIGTFLAT